MKKIIITSIFVSFSVLLGRTQEIRDYYYPINQTTVLEEVMGDHMVGEVSIKTSIVNGYITSHIACQPVNYWAGSAYGVIDYTKIVNNSVILYKREKYIAGSGQTEFIFDYPILKVPKQGQEIKWDGSEGDYLVAKWVDLPTKKGTIKVIRVMEYEKNENYLKCVTYWSRGLGCVLMLNQGGYITRVNPSLFDSRITESSEITDVKNSVERDREHKRLVAESEMAKSANDLCIKLKEGRDLKFINEMRSSLGISFGDKKIYYNHATGTSKEIIGTYILPSLQLGKDEMELINVLSESKDFNYLLNDMQPNDDIDIYVRVETDGRVMQNESTPKGMLFSDINNEIAELFIGQPMQLCIWEDLDPKRPQKFPVATPMNLIIRLDDKILIDRCFSEAKIIEKKRVKTLKMSYKANELLSSDIKNTIQNQIEQGNYKDDHITINIWEYKLGISSIGMLRFRCLEVRFRHKYDGNNENFFSILYVYPIDKGYVN